jgi:hypothetical protein
MRGRYREPSDCPGLGTNVKSTPERSAYYSAWTRCTNPKYIYYFNYGGRGIKFLFTSFDTFLKEVGPKPSPRHRLDRINNDGPYEPGNVRWTTVPRSVINRRKFKGGTSHYRGVHRHHRKWRAVIHIPNPSGRGPGKPLCIGLFSSEIEAAKAYDAKARELFGAEALLNFPGPGEKSGLV